jgi:hypothetical protein
LIEQSVAYKMGKLSQGGYTSYLLRLADEEKLSTESYPNLMRYAGYRLLYESIDIEVLKDEVRELEDRIREKLFRSPDEKALFGFSKKAEVIRDLFDVKLSSAGLAFYKAHGAEFNESDFRKFLDEQGSRYGVTAAAAADLEGIFKALPDAMRFYETAEKRNQALLANTIKKMKENGQSVGCLVTGGFHSRGITELLKEKQLSYVVILPRFDKDKTRPYLTLITNTQDSYRDYAESEQVLEAKMEMTAHFFAQVVFKTAGENSREDDFTKNARAQKAVEKAKEDYVNEYRRCRVA